MLTNEKINNLIGVNESYQSPYKLQELIMDEHKRSSLFERFLKEDNNLAFDWFTDYFQEEHSDRKGKKQDFTPDGIVKIASGILGKSNSNADICAGTGGLTIKRYTENPTANFWCEEFSDRAMPFLLFNLAIRNMNAIVCHGDALTREFKHVYELTSGDRFSSIQEIGEVPLIKNKTVIMNPPYSLPWSPNPEMLNESRFKGFDTLAPKSKADYAFLLQGLSDLDSNGTMTIILPHGVLFRGQAEGKIRRKLLEMNVLDAVIGLPDKAFLATSIPTVILVLKKNRENKDILFIDASKECTKEKSYNVVEDKHVEKILSVYHNRKAIDKFSNLISFKEIQENDFNLNIPRYVDTFVPEPVPSMSEIMADLKKSDEDIKHNAQELGIMMTELQGNTPKADEEVKSFTKYWCDRYGIKINKKQHKNSRGEQLSLL